MGRSFIFLGQVGMSMFLKAITLQSVQILNLNGFLLCYETNFGERKN